MNIAVIDLGTNSVRLMIARGIDSQKINILKSELVTTRLGEGIGKRAYLQPGAIDRTVIALVEFKNIIEKFNVEQIKVVATSAVRDAINKRDFVSIVSQHTGWQVEILSGNKEAWYSYLGVVKGLPGDYENPLVLDIGGGSTEFIWREEERLECRSVNIGAVRATEGEFKDNEIKVLLEPILKLIKNSPSHVIGVGGTVTTLAAIDQKLDIYNSGKVHGYEIKLDKIIEIWHNLKNMSDAERKKVPGLQPSRADVIVAGVNILRLILEKLGTSSIIASETDILYGLAWEMLNRGRFNLGT